jgi:hypothetical protein
VIWSSNPSRVKRFAVFQNGQTGSGFYPASNSMGTDGASLKIKRQGHEDNHSVQYTAEVKNGWNYIYVPIVSPNGVHKKNYIHLTSQTD